MILRDVEGRSAAEVSAATGLSAAQQRDVLNRARELLREHLGGAVRARQSPIMSAAAPQTLSRRLLPLQIGVALQGLILWVPIEKLFMTEIGFDAASVGAMAAAYAAVVPSWRCRRGSWLIGGAAAGYWSSPAWRCWSAP